MIADDQAMVRTGLRIMLEAQGFDVVAEAADGREALEAARQHRPDVCLLDIRMPKLDGLQVTRMLAGPDVAEPMAVVVVTTFDLDEYVRAAIDSGARGFLLKDAGPALVAEAVRAAAVGDALIAPAITTRFLRHFASERCPAADPAPALSEREEEVIRAVAGGLTNQEIGESLFISLGTVKTHVASIQTKLGVRNRVEIAGWAWRTGRMD